MDSVAISTGPDTKSSPSQPTLVRGLGLLDSKDLSGRAQLSTINGRLDARFSHLSGSALELNSVNGSVKLTIPSDAKGGEKFFFLTSSFTG